MEREINFIDEELQLPVLFSSENLTMDLSVGDTVGEGTMYYNKLYNKPSINGVTLNGDKSTSDLLISYADVTNKPQINSVDLTGNKSAADLSLASAGEVSELKNAVNAVTIIDTASGPIASFPDGADGIPVKELKIGIEPVQDLHGYSNPWPGGGGKNLFHFGASREGYTWPDGSEFAAIGANDSFIIVNGTASANHSFAVTDGKFYLEAGTYTLSIGTGNTIQVQLNGENSQGIAVTSSIPQTFTISTAQYIIPQFTLLPGTYSNRKVTIQVESGSTATAYAPYENICPISGFTGANVTRTGKNLFDKNNYSTVNGYLGISDNTITGGSAFRIIYIPCKPNTTYYAKNPATSRANMAYTKETPTAGCSIFGVGAAVCTTGADAKYIVVYVLNSNADTASISDVANSFEITLTENTTPYEPFGTTIPITWQSSAGTVYGGELDVMTGKLTVDREIFTFTGNESWSAYTAWGSDHTYSTRLTSLSTPKQNADVLSEIYKKITQAEALGGTATGIFLRNDTKDFYVSDPNLANADAAKAEFPSGSVIVYELATPVEYTLTAAELTTLLGTNNIWSDTGDTSVDYCADTKLFIEKLTAPTEDDMVANNNIASGKFFMIGNKLFLSTSAIAQGAAIVPGTNCTAMSLAQALNNINQ